MSYKVRGGKTAPKTVKPIVLIVRTRDSQGRPLMLEALYEEQTVDVSNPLNREFLIVFGEPGSWKADPSKVEGRA